MIKRIRYILEAFALYSFYTLCRLLPYKRASDLGGWIGRSLGPKLAASRKARRHIRTAFPNIVEAEETRLLLGMWDNLGRVMAEYPHLEEICRDYLTMENGELVQQLIDQNSPAVFFSCHSSNWEVNCLSTLIKYGKGVDVTYRAPNNPYSDKLLLNARTLGGRLNAYPKSRSAARAILKAIKNGNFLGTMLDQKFSDGPTLDFFGHPASINPGFVELCQKTNCPLIPVQNQRIDKHNIRFVLHPPMQLFEEDGTPRPVNDVLIEINKMFEDWITQAPEQWLWLHRRWK